MNKDLDKSKFWMIVTDGAAFRAREAAVIEASRLSAKEQRRFFIMEAVAYVEPQIVPVKVTEL